MPDLNFFERMKVLSEKEQDMVSRILYTCVSLALSLSFLPLPLHLHLPPLSFFLTFSLPSLSLFISLLFSIIASKAVTEKSVVRKCEYSEE